MLDLIGSDILRLHSHHLLVLSMLYHHLSGFVLSIVSLVFPLLFHCIISLFLLPLSSMPALDFFTSPCVSVCGAEFVRDAQLGAVYEYRTRPCLSNIHFYSQFSELSIPTFFLLACITHTRSGILVPNPSIIALLPIIGLALVLYHPHLEP